MHLPPIRNLFFNSSLVGPNICQVGEKIILEIATSIIYGIAKEEGIIDDDYNLSMIDKLLKEF